MQESEDDITRVAAIELTGLIISLFFNEAGLVCGAAFYGVVLEKQELCFSFTKKVVQYVW